MTDPEIPQRATATVSAFEQRIRADERRKTIAACKKAVARCYARHQEEDWCLEAVREALDAIDELETL